MTAAAPADPAAVHVGEDGIARCAWSGTHPAYQRYHDEEWGVPVHDDRALFEKVCLEGFQAGLSWWSILQRRDAFREAFAGFHPEPVASLTDADLARIGANPAIIRNRAKIAATRHNAQAMLALTVPLRTLIWAHQSTPRPRPARLADIPAITPESTALSADLRARGFRFVGPTTMYALLQSVGVVDDHVVGCHRAA